MRGVRNVATARQRAPARLTNRVLPNNSIDHILKDFCNYGVHNQLAWSLRWWGHTEVLPWSAGSDQLRVPGM